VARKSNKSDAIVADVCLYGTREIGTGFIYSTPEGTRGGDGVPRSHIDLTMGILCAMNELRAAGIRDGKIRIFAPGGKFMAIVGLNQFVYYGNLTWQPAIQYEISVEELLKHADPI
jgi:hypothetical protein